MLETDSTGEPIGPVDPEAPPEVQAAQREAAKGDGGPAKLVVEWDGDDWDIPGEPTIGYARAVSRLNENIADPDANIAVLTALLGAVQVDSLAFSDDGGLRELMDVTSEFIELSQVAWGLGNSSRSSRRSRGTTKR